MSTYPLWFKLVETVFVLAVVAIYARTWGYANFLWFSDIALIGSVPALWLEDGTLASVLALSVLIPDGFWSVSYVARLVTGIRVSGLSDYMFDASKPRWLRALSLFHLWLPLLLLSMVVTFGYDTRALAIMCIGGWLVLAICHRCTDPVENINWVFGIRGGFGGRPQQERSSLKAFALVLVAFPLAIWAPTHFLLRWIAG